MSKESPPPNVPEIGKCPRCGHQVLIGDTNCPNCGLRQTTLEEDLRALNPDFVALAGVLVGGLILLVSLGMEGFAQVFFALLGSAILMGGGIFMAFSYIMLQGRRRRKQ